MRFDLCLFVPLANTNDILKRQGINQLVFARSTMFYDWCEPWESRQSNCEGNWEKTNNQAEKEGEERSCI
ncbi:hypothetical protein FGO68_gene2213 [Halteria grandinella]|uniref:Uncharacterized protein n=1 Tax=Halteria grandinella TaxID=5974 RepID=A0A8J8T736_HALGN|nr:hypothetical protein FGO68_gene2213 [Halteria grandinella]